VLQSLFDLLRVSTSADVLARVTELLQQQEATEAQRGAAQAEVATERERTTAANTALEAERASRTRLETDLADTRAQVLAANAARAIGPSGSRLTTTSPTRRASSRSSRRSTTRRRARSLPIQPGWRPVRKAPRAVC
jgi:hypothetical protein